MPTNDPIVNTITIVEQYAEATQTKLPLNLISKRLIKQLRISGLNYEFSKFID
jgi:hypothetical protein